MSNSIVTENNQDSPFDSIRRYNSKGQEFWSARELMPLLGYMKWDRFGGKESIQTSVIEKAVMSCQTSGCEPSNHFEIFPNQGISISKLKYDWKLSRYAAYLVAMNGDVTKPQIASAQAYFVIKTRQAETIIPEQLDEIEKLRLKNENLKLELEILINKRAIESFRYDVVTTCPEAIQQKVLGCEIVTEVQIIQQVINTNGDVLNNGDTISKTELCLRYGFTTKDGSPDYKKLNFALNELCLEQDSTAWMQAVVPQIKRQFKRSRLTELDRRWLMSNRQLFLGE